MISIEAIKVISALPSFKAIRAASIIFAFSAVAGCSSEIDYDQCILDAAQSGKSQYATELMVEVCDRKKSEQEAIKLSKSSEPCYEKIRNDYASLAYTRYPEEFGGGLYTSRVDWNGGFRQDSIDRFNLIVDGFRNRQEKNNKACSIDEFNSYVVDVKRNIGRDLDIFLYGRPLEVEGAAAATEEEAEAVEAEAIGGGVAEIPAAAEEAAAADDRF
ncbi:hypothetical protein [Altererythrobacter litoralis]|uniref:DUF2799 domain-containing protein n=1 Tax=Altererythrobacter litoralis TaxID=3113904 RepID=A0ABU7GGB5_9SPHN|nr:hypothetical protein [Erythrobacteraceae bacterium 1XM1-14]